MEMQLLKDHLLKNLDILREKIQDYPYSFQVTKVNVDGSSHSESMLPLGSLAVFGSEKLSNDQEDDLLSKFLFGYLAKAKTLNYIDDSFNELFEELDYFEKTRKYIFRTIGFISGFQLDEKIEIEPNFSLINPSSEYLEFFYNIWYDPKPGLLDFLRSDLRNLVLLQSGLYFENVQYLESQKGISPIRSKVERLMQAVLLNTNLTKSFHVSTAYTFSYLYKFGSPISLEYFDFPDVVSELRKSPLKGEVIKKTYSSVCSLDTTSIGISLRRLSDVRNRRSPEDKYLDLIIALEALFPKIDRELTFRVSLLVGALLKSKQSCHLLSELYRARGKIAHGLKVSEVKLKGKPKVSINEALLLLEDIVRTSVLKSIELVDNGVDAECLEEHLLERLFVQ